MKVLTFGEILLRLASPGYNKLFQKDILESTFCGAEANVAVALSNLGIDTLFLTVVPNNDVGESAIRSLNYFKVNTSKCIFSDCGRMGLFYLEKGASQRPSKVIYDRAYSSISLSNVDDYDWDNILKDINLFHFSGITPALSPNCAKAVEKACKIAKKYGVLVSCDLNYRKKLWSKEEAQKVMRPLMQYVDICIGNEEDAEMVLGTISSYEDTIEKYTHIANQIKEKYNTKVVAFSLRDSINANINNWSGLLFKDNQLFVSKKYQIHIVDRVGGGDSFAAGLLYGLLNNMDSQETIDFAIAASCLKHTIEGDYFRFSVLDVLNLLNGNENGRIKR